MTILSTLKTYRAAYRNALDALQLLPAEYQQAMGYTTPDLPTWCRQTLEDVDALIEHAREDARAELRAERAKSLADAALKYVRDNEASLPVDVAEGLKIATGEQSIDDIKITLTEETK